MNLTQKKSELIFKLGQLLGPFLKACENPSQYDADEIERIKARFFSDVSKFNNEADRFCDQPGHYYSNQLIRFNREISNITNSVRGNPPSKNVTIELSMYINNFQ